MKKMMNWLKMEISTPNRIVVKGFYLGLKLALYTSTWQEVQWKLMRYSRFASELQILSASNQEWLNKVTSLTRGWKMPKKQKKNSKRMPVPSGKKEDMNNIWWEGGRFFWGCNRPFTNQRDKTCSENQPDIWDQANKRKSSASSSSRGRRGGGIYTVENKRREKKKSSWQKKIRLKFVKCHFSCQFLME